MTNKKLDATGNPPGLFARGRMEKLCTDLHWAQHKVDGIVKDMAALEEEMETARVPYNISAKVRKVGAIGTFGTVSFGGVYAFDRKDAKERWHTHHGADFELHNFITIEPRED